MYESGTPQRLEYKETSVVHTEVVCTVVQELNRREVGGLDLAFYNLVEGLLDRAAAGEKGPNTRKSVVDNCGVYFNHARG